jgi:uncharacterized membrane protein YfcA
VSAAILISGIVIFLSHTLEAITGFGCAALAMPFVTSLIGMDMGVRSVTVIAWLLALYIAISKRKEIQFKQFLIIFGCMIAGMPAGMYIFRSLDTAVLKKVLAAFIIAVSIWQILLVLLKKPVKQGPLSAGEWVIYIILLVLGGVVHGAFSSGGPLVVLYAKRQLHDKGQFRATLCLLWSVLNTILITTYFIEGSFTGQTAIATAEFVPFLIAGIFAGEYLHGKVNEKIFSLLVFITLLVTGVFMLVF